MHVGIPLTVTRHWSARPSVGRWVAKPPPQRIYSAADIEAATDLRDCAHPRFQRGSVAAIIEFNIPQVDRVIHALFLILAMAS